MKKELKGKGYIIAIALFSIALYGCSPKLFNPQMDQGDYLAIGKGGGFRGSVTTYYSASALIVSLTYTFPLGNK